ncbi:glutamate receptor-like [Limulus polyphemus]|uniref:Glutamate receptor-like n=1 Tax=Limulus polyphemus TaxID=6850 RepID=A0ABM1TDN1_LIMPO|nr:glutamate receptor-like [Limulus polyphemus]
MRSSRWTNLRVAVEGWFPFIQVTRDLGDEIKISGPMAKVLEHLSRSLNFNYTLMTPVDHYWGIKLPKGNWTGMVGMVHRQEADIALGSFTINYDRYQATEMTNTFYTGQLCVLTGPPQQTAKFFKYLLSYAWEVWLCSLMTLLVLVVISVSFLKMNEKRYSRSNWMSLALRNLWSFCKLHLYQGLSEMEEKKINRLVLSSWLFAVFMLMSSFSGHLESSLMVKEDINVIDSLEDLLKHPHIQPLVEAESILEAVLSTSPHETYREIWSRIKEKPDSRLPFQELEKDEVLDMVDAGTHAIIIDTVTIKGILNRRFLTGKSCQFHVSTKKFHETFLVMIMRKDLEATIMEGIRTNIDSFTQSHLLTRWIEDMTINGTKCQTNTAKDVGALNTDDLSGAFLLWLCGLMTSLFAFTGEFVLWRKCVRHGYSVSGV